MITRPRGDSLGEVMLKVHAPVRLPSAATPRPLDELVVEWRERYGGAEEARPCACGGVVLALPADPGPGVREHQRTDRHRRWAHELG